MFRRSLVACWVIVFGIVVLLGIFPKILSRIPRPDDLRAIVMLLMLVPIIVSGIYALLYLYKAGMGRATRN
jgi:hypothetical protein